METIHSSYWCRKDDKFFEKSFCEIDGIREDKKLMVQKQKNCEFCIPHHNNSSVHLL